MKDELQRIILAYSNCYQLSRQEAIKAIKRDLTEQAKELKPVNLKGGKP